MTLTSPIGAAGAFLAAAAVSLALTGAIRRLAISLSVVDTPNARSSHAIPVPRGAGLAIVITTLAFLAGSMAFMDMPVEFVAGIGGGGLLMALVGLADDVRPLSSKVRLLAQFAAAVWTCAWLGWLPSIDIGGASIALGWLGFVLPVLGLVWSTNLFNFMDGTDGLAGTEGALVAGIGGLLLWQASAYALALLALVIAASCLGFLRWNWAPAKIFMGDVGSGFLGFVFAAVAIASENTGTLALLVWAGLASVFILDATVTFVRRARRGKWDEAHRTHAYQRLVQSGWSHARVARLVAWINVGLGAVAYVSVVYPGAKLAAAAACFAVSAAWYVWVEGKNPMQSDPRPAGAAKNLA